MASWNARRILDKYILDYMIKKNMVQAAETFAREADVDDGPVAMDVTGGFLKEWWASFWEVYTAINPPNAENQTITTMEEMVELFSSMFPNLPFRIPPPAPGTAMSIISNSASSPNPMPVESPVNAMETTAAPMPSTGPKIISQEALLGGIFPVLSSKSDSSVNSPAVNPGGQMPTMLMHGQEDLAAKLQHLNVLGINSTTTSQVAAGHDHNHRNLGFGRGVPETPNFPAKMDEKDYLMRTGQADLLAAKLPSFGVGKMSQMPSSSSQFSPQVQKEVIQLEDILEKIEQRRISVEVQQQQQSRGAPHQPGRGGRHNVDAETSKVVPIPGEDGGTLAENDDVASKGKGKLV